MSTILFVCTGNVCRSPMAVGIMRHRLDKANPGNLHRVFSAGVWALDGEPASPNAVAVMAERGIHIADHIAHTITSGDMAEADLVLTMSQEHTGMIAATWPQYNWKVFRLSEMSGKRSDIRDPYGQPIAAYRVCADEIARYIDRGLRQILESL